jgi:hypothetical protein
MTSSKGGTYAELHPKRKKPMRSKLKYIRCKNCKGKIGHRIVMDLFGNWQHANQGYPIMTESKAELKQFCYGHNDEGEVCGCMKPEPKEGNDSPIPPAPKGAGILG